MDKRFNIYYAGEVLDGHDPTQVRANLGKLFKANEQTLDKLFSGKAQLLKKGCDEDKARQYQQAMQRAGAQPIIRAAQPADAGGATDAPAPAGDQPEKKLTAAEKIAALAAAEDDTRYRAEDSSGAGQSPPAASEPTTAADEGSLGLEPEGTEVLKAHERAAPVEASIDTSKLAVDETAARLSEEAPAAPPAPDTSHLDMGEVGEVIPTLEEAVEELDPDISALDLSPEGSDFSDCAGPDPIAPDVDLSALDLAPSGSDVLEEQYRRGEEQAPPNTDHISVQD